MIRLAIGNANYRPRHTRKHAKTGRATRLVCLLALRLAL